MTKEIKTSITIHASREKIWRKLIQFNTYAQWNPFVKSIEGQPAKGERLKVIIQNKPNSTMTFKPMVLECKENSALTWRGSLLFDGVFDGTHSFRLIEQENGSTTFLHEERFSGLLVGLFNLEDTKKGFEAMNKALKDLCEA
jgi:hypothetical protein